MTQDRTAPNPNGTTPEIPGTPAGGAPADGNGSADGARFIAKNAGALGTAADQGAPGKKADKPADRKSSAQKRRDPEAIRRAFETGEYPYQTRMTNKSYLEHMALLQVELLKAQS